ncbi:MAG: phosphoribosyltransferase family protein [Candidatus Nitrosocosmicus sp.]
MKKLKDRQEAAFLLVEKLKKENIIKGEKNNVIVISVPRGGIVLGKIIAEELGYDFGLIIPRKLTVPQNHELAFGAIIDKNNFALNNDIIKKLNITEEEIEGEKEIQLEEIENRRKKYGHMYEKKYKDKIIVLVDDGVATGYTILISLIKINQQEPKELILCTPVIPDTTFEFLNKYCDKIMYLIKEPDFLFSSVGQFYNEFRQIEDEEIERILSKVSL